MVEAILLPQAEMLKEYFSIDISKDGKLTALPCVLTEKRQINHSQHLLPDPSRLPMLIFNLVMNVNWEEEAKCFQDIAAHFSAFYCLEAIDKLDETYQQQLELLFSHFIKHRIKPPKRWVTNKTIIQLADTETLFKIFERC